MTLAQLDAFALTLAVECVVVAALAPSLKLSPLACAGAAALGSTITHPVLWAIYPLASNYLAALTTPVLEAFVITAETFAYRAMATRRWDEAALLSLLANAASWWAGEMIYRL